MGSRLGNRAGHANSIAVIGTSAGTTFAGHIQRLPSVSPGGNWFLGPVLKNHGSRCFQWVERKMMQRRRHRGNFKKRFKSRKRTFLVATDDNRRAGAGKNIELQHTRNYKPKEESHPGRRIQLTTS